MLKYRLLLFLSSYLIQDRIECFEYNEIENFSNVKWKNTADGHDGSDNVVSTMSSTVLELYKYGCP